jgi:hypothetical protein
MNIITPLSITASLIGAGCTLAEDPTAAWAAGTFALGDERHVVATHRVYRCAVAGASALSPELEPTRWQDRRPTNRMAPFDIYTSTAATTTAGDIVYPITARFCNAVALYGAVGSTYDITVRDVAGGTVIYNKAGRLREPSRGWWRYLFGGRRPLAKVIATGIPIRPAAEITITIHAGSGATRSLGMIVLGKYRSLIGLGARGGTEYGSSVEPVSYGYNRTEDDGTTTWKPGSSATNLRCKIVLPRDQADNAVRMLQEVLGIPVACIATDASGYDGLSTFGIISAAPVSYDGHGHASIDATVKGII